ncbi:MAG: NAD(P)H-dependent oxidoreductase [Chloroflexi bacterium]|nr:NAD(P)H-dependent oxidoreductase [Chloroflexota bacterium]
MKVVSIVGSLRQDSWNHKLTRAATDILRSKGVEVEEASLGGLTLFSGDLDDGTFPEPVAALRSAMQGADGLLVASPEYNHSISAVMKNAIEWTCRPPNCWTNKVVFAMSTTPGRSGGIRMHLHLSDCLQCEGAWLIPRPMVLVPNAASVFDSDGNLLDQSVGDQLEEAMTTLVNTINTMSGARA